MAQTEHESPLVRSSSTKELNGKGAANLEPPRETEQETFAFPVSPPVLQTSTRRKAQDGDESAWDRWRLVVAAIGCWVFIALGLIADHLLGLPDPVVTTLFLAAYLAGGTFSTITAVRNLANRHVTVDVLMITAAIGAAIIGYWEEGAILLGLFSSSNALEQYALGRTHRAVRSLMDLSPDEAMLLREDLPDGQQMVPVEDLAIGDVVLIRPGERIPVDGVVMTGESACDQAPITGESIPVEKKPGSQVFAGTINTTGSLQVRVTTLAQESMLARIIRIVDEAQGQKSRTQRFTDAFEGKYAIAVILGSIAAFFVFLTLFDYSRSDAFYRAITLLVVASPCALVISTPASTLSGLANAARNGILFKGSGHLENLGMVNTVAFDKTGTLTVGKHRVTDVVSCDTGWTEDEILVRAASAERLSEHHLGAAIVERAIEDGLELQEAANFGSTPGKGIIATLDDLVVAVGNPGFFEDLGVNVWRAAQIAASLRAEGKTAILVGDRDNVRGVIGVADTLRPSAHGVVEELHQLGVRQTVMLTGDHEAVAEVIAEDVGIDEIYADLLPEEKLGVINRMERSGPVAMVGDGVNDAPALATATVGVAMGGAGTDVALETAGVVLVADDLTKLPYAVSLSRRTRRTIVQNLTFSLGVIAILVTSALTIGIPLPLGVVGHEGSTVIVVLNGLRLLRTPRRWRTGSSQPAAGSAQQIPPRIEFRDEQAPPASSPASD
jgi:Cd2+/Zn2+-exporting ATPase